MPKGARGSGGPVILDVMVERDELIKIALYGANSPFIVFATDVARFIIEASQSPKRSLEMLE